ADVSARCCCCRYVRIGCGGGEGRGAWSRTGPGVRRRQAVLLYLLRWNGRHGPYLCRRLGGRHHPARRPRRGAVYAPAARDAAGRGLLDVRASVGHDHAALLPGGEDRLSPLSRVHLRPRFCLLRLLSAQSARRDDEPPARAHSAPSSRRSPLTSPPYLMTSCSTSPSRSYMESWLGMIYL